MLFSHHEATGEAPATSGPEFHLQHVRLAPLRWEKKQMLIPQNLFFFLIKIELIYNVVPISAVEQNDSVIRRYTLVFFYSFPSWSIPGDWI